MAFNRFQQAAIIELNYYLAYHLEITLVWLNYTILTQRRKERYRNLCGCARGNFCPVLICVITVMIAWRRYRDLCYLPGTKKSRKFLPGSKV
jgi:hypothetical protein